MFGQIPRRQVDRRADRRLAFLPKSDGPVGDAKQPTEFALRQSQTLPPGAQFLPIHQSPPIFQGLPGERLTPPVAPVLTGGCGPLASVASTGRTGRVGFSSDPP